MKKLDHHRGLNFSSSCLFQPFLIRKRVHYGSDIFCLDLLYWGSDFDCLGSSPEDFSSHHDQMVSTCRHLLAVEKHCLSKHTV